MKSICAQNKGDKWNQTTSPQQIKYMIITHHFFLHKELCLIVIFIIYSFN